MLASVVLALLGGLALTAAFEPLGYVVLAPLGVAAAVASVQRVRDRRPVAALLPGMVLGLAFVTPLMSWLSQIGTDAWIAVSILEASFYAGWALAARLLLRLPGWPVWVTLAWVATETLRGSVPFGGFPWGRLAFATVGSPYAAGLPWWGAAGTSALVAATGVGLVWAVRTSRPRRVVALAAAAVALLVLGPTLVSPDVGDGGTARVAAVQGDVPGDGTDVLADPPQLFANHVDATTRLGDQVAAGETSRPDLVVWPENSTTFDPFASSSLGTAIDGAVAAVGAPVLVGAIVDGPSAGQVLNQGIAWSPRSGPGDRYTKSHPVPFGEFVPFRDSSLLGPISAQVERLDLVPRDMLAGTRETPLEVDGLRVGDAICFDVAYDDVLPTQVRNGAQLLVVQTSNALFIDTAQIDQQFEISRVRAIEAGRSTVVTAINGVSGVIGPDGEVLGTADPRTRAVLEADVPLATRATPGVVVGGWTGRGAVVVTGLGLALVLLTYRRRRSRQQQSPHEEVG